MLIDSYSYGHGSLTATAFKKNARVQALYTTANGSQTKLAG